jgi:hypothetical protein
MIAERRVAAVLLHHPVLDRDGQIVTTAITNLDLHDLARSAHCFGLTDLFVAHPVAAQRELAQRVRDHWTTGSGARRIPDRKPALEILRIKSALEDAVEALGGEGNVEIWTTSAKSDPATRLDFSTARQRLRGGGPPVLIVLGTGWGLAPQVTGRAHVHLDPIASPRADGFNHLSVRAAGAIIFDRLLGRDAADR